MQNVSDFFCQPGLVRLAMLFPLDTDPFKVIDLLGQLAALFEQPGHDLERRVVVRKPVGQSSADRHEALHQVGWDVHTNSDYTAIRPLRRPVDRSLITDYCIILNPTRARRLSHIALS